MLSVRPATSDDVAAMVAMVEAHRARLEQLQPVFWRKAANSGAMSAMWFGHLVASSENAHCLIADEAGTAVGFLIATPTLAPPTVAPGGATWTVDDFCVVDGARWHDAGLALWDAIETHGRANGWAQIVCVSPVGDEAKNAMLEQTRLAPTSLWWSAPLSGPRQ